MANGEKRLSALAVRNAAPGVHADGGSLFLEVSAAGRRKWTWRYRSGARVRDMGLGDADHVPLTEAREQRDRWRKELALGRDPVELRRTEKSAGITFGEIADEVMALKERELRNPKSAAQWAMTLKEYAAPLRNKPVARITTQDVLAVLKPLWSRVNETASRLRGRIERVIDHARAHGHIPADSPNPARWRGHLELLLGARGKPARGHHAAMAYDDAPAFLQWLRGRQGVSARALEFTILTAARTGETIGARKSEFDLQSAVWTIPAERMKAARDHRVPLGDAALAVAKVALSSKGAYLFSGMRGKTLSNMAMSELLKHRAPPSVATVHGFRASFKSWAEDKTDHAREVIEAALAHTIGDKAEQAYRRSDALEKRRALMRDWQRFLEDEQAPKRRRPRSAGRQSSLSI
jgi:integrase